MSKKKKKGKKQRQGNKRPKHKPSDHNALPKRERKQLEALFEAKDWDNLVTALVQMRETYPKAPEIYAMMCFLAQEVQDADMLAHGAYHWQRYAPHHPDALALWSHVALDQMRPGHAMRAMQTLCQLWPDHPEVPQAMEQINALAAVWDELVEEIGLAGRDDALQLMCYHEDAQIALTEERFGEALSISKQVLSRMPSYPAAHNTAGLAQFSMGKVDAALECCVTVLAEHDPNNIHAMANAIHYLVLLDRMGEAETWAANLKECALDDDVRDDAFVKKAEGLSYFGDHEGVIECLDDAREYIKEEQSKASDDDKERGFEDLPHAALLCHLGAVASYKLGDEDGARKLWKEALSINPDLRIADDNLGELHKSTHERFSPWYFSIYNWLPIELFTAMLPLHEAIEEEGHLRWDALADLAPIVDEIFDKFSVLEGALPHLLGRCGPESQEILRLLMLTSQRKEQLEQLAEYAQGPEGPDQERGLLLRLLLDVGHLPRGQQIQIWAQGRQVPQLLLGYQLDDTPPSLPNPAKEILQEIQETLAKKQLIEAKKLYETLFAQYPAEPDIASMALHYARTNGDVEHCQQLCDQLTDSNPMLPALAGTRAWLAMQQADDAAAREALEPLLSQARFRAADILLVCELQIELCLRAKDNTSAIQWLALARKLLPEHPALPQMQKQFGIWARIKRWFRRH